MLTNRGLRILLHNCKEYIKDENYVYKLCLDCTSEDTRRKWLIILKKCPDTKTNEARDYVFDKFYAKFRANKLEVIKIINIRSPQNTKTTIISEFKDIKTKYTVGEIINANSYEEDINIICAPGIHYFKTIRPAYYYRRPSNNYTGKWYTWHDNGLKSMEGCYKYGIKEGTWNSWDDIGIKMEE